MPSRVLFLGPLSSYSHAAAVSIYPDAAELVPLPDFPTIFRNLDKPTTSADTVVDTRGEPSQSSQIYGERSASPSTTHSPHHEYAVIPVYNSTNGPVAPVIDFLKRSGNGTILAELTRHGLRELDDGDSNESRTIIDAQHGEVKTHTLSPDHPPAPVSIEPHERRDYYPNIELAPPYTYALAVHHHLYVHPVCPVDSIPSTHPASSTHPAQIISLHTHPQVWTQCTRFLDTHFPNPESSTPSPPIHSEPPATMTNTARISHNSTSEAAAYVLNTKPPTAGEEGWPAVLCSEMAGTRYGLKCIAQNIEDDVDGNQTTFIVLRNRLQVGLENGGLIT
ncbi:uncharacterized protein AB675_162 [Cyphellophora attinorum]|uniref:Prephenate dehydratase domain-containing protein n=1 Tax=Cyphellophora attinorum TaxID=1664694 RepID=A0A0N1H6D6_9EURO|nr:uncharacterized protein AB675_162 [Phialophora attinorum]KPI37720.1 hypothetical protein AB675_162 [Phialophora attinorum]